MATPRRATAAVLLALACALGATGCTPTPGPTASPSASGFASDDAAFAAAEATYRAYVDATNSRRSDPNSRPDPTDFLTSAAYNDEIETQRTLSERGWRISGETVLADIKRVAADSDHVQLEACLDASNTRVLDNAGVNVTPPDRAARLGIELTLIRIGDVMLVSDSRTSPNPC